MSVGRDRVTGSLHGMPDDDVVWLQTNVPTIWESMPREQWRLELARFNAERERMMGGKPAEPGARLPLPFTGVGGDLPENG